MKRQGAHIITYPSAFSVPTGKAHWELLLRGRAVETQCYSKISLEASLYSLFSTLSSFLFLRARNPVLLDDFLEPWVFSSST